MSHTGQRRGPSLSVALLLVTLIAHAAWAGPNAGGTLLLHHNPNLVYTNDDSYCGWSDLARCEETNARVEGSEIVVLHAIAAFSLGSEPRLKGVTFGIQYDENLALANVQSCADFELSTALWPKSGEGTALVWNQAKTSALTELCWFAAYAIDGNVTQLSLVPHPIQDSDFADDSVPPDLDPITDFGSMGFNQPGHFSCPSPVDAIGACCLPDGHCEIYTQPTCLEHGGTYLGEGVPCSPHPCPIPEACCFEDGSCLVLMHEECMSQGGTGQGAWTTCDSNPCEPLPGACCLWDGSCSITNIDECSQLSGIWIGYGTDCEPYPCPSLGACCTPWGNCVITNEQSCTSAGYIYVGDGVDCEPNPCTVPGACCIEGLCFSLTSSQCSAEGGSFQGEGTSCEETNCAPVPTEKLSWGRIKSRYRDAGENSR